MKSVREYLTRHIRFVGEASADASGVAELKEAIAEAFHTVMSAPTRRQYEHAKGVFLDALDGSPSIRNEDRDMLRRYFENEYFNSRWHPCIFQYCRCGSPITIVSYCIVQRCIRMCVTLYLTRCNAFLRMYYHGGHDTTNACERYHGKLKHGMLRGNANQSFAMFLAKFLGLPGSEAGPTFLSDFMFSAEHSGKLTTNEERAEQSCARGYDISAGTSWLMKPCREASWSGVWTVTSASDASVKYVVDLTRGFCSCPAFANCFGVFPCKHLCGCRFAFHEQRQRPGVKMHFDTNAVSKTFWEPFDTFLRRCQLRQTVTGSQRQETTRASAPRQRHASADRERLGEPSHGATCRRSGCGQRQSASDTKAGTTCEGGPTTCPSEGLQEAKDE